MLGRYIKHRKWVKELNKYLSKTENIKFLIRQFEKTGISDIVIFSDNRNNILFQKLKNSLRNNTNFPVHYEKNWKQADLGELNKKSIVISSDRLRDQAFKYGIPFLSLYDLHNLFLGKQYFMTEIPRVINSIENGYRSVGVLQSGKYAEQIEDYLRGNSGGLHIIKIREEQWKGAGNERKYCYGGEERIDIVIVMDLRIPADVVDKDGKSISAFFLLNFASEENGFISNSSTDIAENIVPFLVKEGVEVLWCQMPQLSHFPSEVKRKINRDNKIRSISPRLYSLIRKNELKRENREFMYGLGKYTKIDCSKGYRECFGNMEHLNYDNGFRRTIGNDSESRKNIWVFGPCLVEPNARVDDADTITSQLKRRVGKGYNVHNRGGSFGGMSLLMRNTRFRKGDIAVIFSIGSKVNESATVNYDLTLSYQKVDYLERHINDNLLHCDHKVIKQIGDDLYDLMRQNRLLYDQEETGEAQVCLGNKLKRVPDIRMLEDSKFKKYITDLRKQRYEVKDGRAGAVVMNCNPFTFGHRYLVETAAGQVDKLFVFVVEEDKSFFSFKDRIELVKEGTKDIINVCVVPSGRYIASSQTLAGYFERDTIGDIYLDASTDLELFAQVANALNITIRFAGEEPLDIFTRQYNNNMRIILESYGIEFFEIKRKEENGKPISASTVRMLLKQKKFDAISEIVPLTTFNYLVKTFGDMDCT